MADSTLNDRATVVPASRIARLTRLGSMTAGVAGNMAMNGVVQLGQGKRPTMRNLLLTPANVRRVTEQLAQMRGAAMKIGQLVSMDTGDVLPAELSDLMARLRSDAHFMPPAQLKKVLNSNWKCGWLQAFDRFDVRPIAAASIGQVHRARLKDGRQLAIKVQYPGVSQSIDSDVTNVGALIKLSGLLPAGFELAPYLEEARKQLHEETDYIREGQHLADFKTLLEDDARFELPSLHEEWTTREILAMSFVEALSIEAVADHSQEERDKVAHDLIDLLFSELFTFGLMQTDPNFANYRYNPETGRIVLLDFGATRRIDPGITDLYRRLIAAGLAQDSKAQYQIAIELGLFDLETKSSHQDRIVKMIGMVFAELKDSTEFDFAKTDLSRHLQAEGMMLAEEGFLPPPLPIDALYLQRKFGGIFLLARKLKARLPVTQLMEARLF